MKSSIPSAADVRARLKKLTYAELKELAPRAKVGFSTLWRIREGASPNPGIETVRKFMRVVDSDKAAA